MHRDHDIFAKAIQEKKKVKLTFFANEHDDIRNGLFGPIFYSPSAAGDNPSCYYLWDFESEAGNNFLGLPPSRIASMKLGEEPFDCVEFFTSKRAIMVEKTQSETERRSSEEDRRSGLDRRYSTASYNGPERRSGNDRRCIPERRSGSDMQTYKQFYQHVVTESVYAIERRLDGTLIGSCGPLPVDDLKPHDSYNYTTVLNDWLESQSDKLMLV
ncbi:MAG: hypothetical protein ACYSUY_06910 [Planctomycetota bacterium]|jgi:hypothetical protein